MGRYSEAIENLHLAISLNPKDNTEALAELERVEGFLRGEQCNDSGEQYVEDSQDS